ncbi:hypothetical protein EOL96_01320 [Candidatus Saccharibacteria bacterium]|nr:hypothetical protein [Candidatus Saccharibacteria bacterium]
MDYTMGTRPNDTFYKAAFDAIAHAKLLQIGSNGMSPQVTFVHNDVTVTVCSDSDLQLILRDCERALAGCMPPLVGPYPVPKLS